MALRSYKLSLTCVWAFSDSRSPDGKIRADFTIIFPENETPTLKPVNDAIATGVLGGLPVISKQTDINFNLHWF